MSESATLEAPAVTEIALVDLSSIAYPLWHMSGAQPDPDWTSQQIVARIRSLTATHPKAAICRDGGKSFRNELSPDYKAQREAAPAALHHQIALACERLEAEGYPVWTAKGFEADDVIASAVTIALQLADTTVLVMSADKDLLQLVGPRVRALSTNNGTVYDAEAVVAKFGVKPEQIRDYLTLVGDSSDNVRGAKSVGPKTAAALLKAYGSIAGIYEALTNHGTQFKPALATNLRDFQPRVAETQTLITLRTDAEVPFADLDRDRALSAPPMEDEPMPTDATEVIAEPVRVELAPRAEAEKPAEKPTQPTIAAEVLAPAPVEFERQLEPRSLQQAMQLSNHMHSARMFNGYGSPQGVLSTVLAGRELGLQAIASLRAFHVIEGKHALAADAMRGLVLRSGQAKYFRCVERTAERATFETWRKEEPEPVRLTYTVEEGRAAFGFADTMPESAKVEREKSWAKSAWAKHTPDMLAARASSKLARLVYSDILFGLYSPEELRD